LPDFRGAFTATLTPFDERGEVDFDYIQRHLRYQEENGIDGVVPSGTNGEGPSLSLHERKRIVEFVIQNKGSMLVIAGTGCANQPETIELTSFAAEVGADAVLIVPPYFYKNVAGHGLADYYRRVLDSAPIPVLLYNIPSLTGVEITDDLLQALADRPNLAGVKDTSGDIAGTKAYVANFPDLAILNGSDWLIQESLAAGAAGTISGLSNVFPHLISAIYDDFRAGKDVSDAQQRINSLKDIFAKYPPFAGNKFALTLQGFPLTHVRPALVDLSKDERRRMQAELRQIGP
jgi:4-hydroxy-tetrahydrodipicolinate synthase